MSSTFSKNIPYLASRWALGAAVFALWATMGPGVAWAVNDGACSIDAAATAAAEEVAQTTMTQDALTPAFSDLTVETPCETADHSSRSNNVCFSANAHPISTVPDWLAELQAEEAVASVFSQVNEIHRQAASTQDPLPPILPTPWLDELIDEIQQAGIDADPGNLCIEHDGDTCESLPPLAAGISLGSLSPIYRIPLSIQIPWRPDETDEQQDPLVDLRVGPATEHRRLPEQPPPA